MARGLVSDQAPCAEQASRVKAAGAAPEPLNPAISRPSSTRQKASPPTPLDMGCTSPSTASEARAASIAVPPSPSAQRAASTANGLEVATMAPRAHDGDPIATGRYFPCHGDRGGPVRGEPQHAAGAGALDTHRPGRRHVLAAGAEPT